MAQADLSEAKLADYIAELITVEMELAEPLLSLQDKLLGYSLPGIEKIKSMAYRIASAIKMLPSNSRSIEWQKAMVNIFGGSLRFVVERQLPEKKCGSEKFKRTCLPVKNVKLDDAVYKNSGLFFGTNFYLICKQIKKVFLKKYFLRNFGLIVPMKMGFRGWYP